MAIIFIFFITNKGYAQTGKTNSTDSANSGRDTTGHIINPVFADSLKADSSKADTSRRKMLERSMGIKISKDELSSVVNANAQDSAVMDMKHNLFYLYGGKDAKADVTYEDLKLNAGKVVYQQSTNVISASPMEINRDTGATKQTFTQGKEKFIYDSIQYNFKSKRAIVRNVHSQYGEGFVFSEQVKRNPDQSIFGLHSVYTTCALDTPHFGIYAKRILVIPGHVIISGPANIEIEGVPTPLWLPFGLFPVSEKQMSGFVLPTYTIEQQRGLGLINGGYYLHFNDHVDLLTQANVYTKGSYAISGISDYSDIYQYKGLFSFSYALNKTGEDFEPGASTEKDFMLNWRHQSDPKAVPGQTFNASVQVGTSTYYSNNSYDPNQILQNQYQSNISYTKNWQGTPFSLTISALHNQNTTTKQINVTLPDINFHITQLNPFQKKSSTGKHWYDKITLSYTMDGLNQTTFYDSTFSLSNLKLNQFQAGVHQAIPLSASYTVFRYINVSFSANYDEYWVNNKLYQYYNPVDNKLDSNENYGFYASRDFNTGVSFSSRIYGLVHFKKGKIKGIRHVITPSIGFSYHPDFAADPFNYYYRTHLDTPITPTNYTLTSPYMSSVVGYPPSGKSGLVSFGINNNLQIKVKSSKDTVTGYKNVTLIDAFGITTSYNAAADSFQWSPIALNFRTNVLDKINISSSANFDPYAFDYLQDRRVPILMEQEGFGLARFSSATLALGSNFHSKPSGGGTDPSNSEEYGRVMRNAGYNDYVDFNVPWSFNVSYSMSANEANSTITKRDTVVYNQSLTFQGEVKLTERWKLNLSTGYNFNYHELTLTSIDIYRDLHCWAMHFQAVPFGPRKSYSFTLNVKASILQDLKLTKRRDYRDAAY